MDRLEQEFLQEQLDFVQKTIFLTLAPCRGHPRAPLSIIALPWQGAAEADLEALSRRNEKYRFLEKYRFSEEIELFLQKFLL